MVLVGPPQFSSTTCIPLGECGTSSDNTKKAIEPIFSKTSALVGLDYFKLGEYSPQMAIGDGDRK